MYYCSTLFDRCNLRCLCLYHGILLPLLGHAFHNLFSEPLPVPLPLFDLLPILLLPPLRLPSQPPHLLPAPLHLCFPPLPLPLHPLFHPIFPLLPQPLPLLGLLLDLPDPLLSPTLLGSLRLPQTLHLIDPGLEHLKGS